MPNQKWFCLNDTGGHLLQGTEQAYDQKELPGAGSHNRETTAGLRLRSISRSAHHTPGLALSRFPSSNAASPSSPHSVPSDPLPLLSGAAAQGTCPGGTAAQPALEDGGKTVGNRTESILSRGPAKKSEKPTILSGNCFPICLCDSQHTAGSLLKKLK